MSSQTDPVTTDNEHSLPCKQESEGADNLLNPFSDVQINKALEPEIPWLGTKQVCDFFKVSHATLYKWRLHRKLAYCQIGRKIYYKMEDLNAFLHIHYYKPYTL